MMIGLAVQRSTIHGRGLFATVQIQKDTLLGEYLGRNIHYHEGVYIGDYCMRADRNDGAIELRDARYGGNDLRFINHSHSGNVRPEGFLFYANCDISPGQELTMDYGHGFT